MPADRHYISEQRARRILTYYINTHTVKTFSIYKRCMYESFVEQCELLMKENSNLLDVCNKAVYMPAKGFGLSPSRIYTLLHRMGAR